MITLPSLVDDANFARLKRYVLDQTGLEYYGNRGHDLGERVRRRMTALRIECVGDYLSLIQQKDLKGHTERDALIDAVTIGETYFFRFPEQFDALRERVLPYILRQNQSRRTLNIWCAGCSSGAEPHTVSILLRRDFGSLLHDWQVSVLGTDINERALVQARDGWYASWTLRTLEGEDRDVLFDRDPKADRYILKTGYRRGTHFIQQNLIHDAPPMPESGAWDVIFCRNVLIYFDAETISRMITRFAECLAPGGYLFLGHAEPGPVVGMEKWFETVRYPGVILYRRLRSMDIPATIYHPLAEGPAYVPPVPSPPPPAQAVWSPLELPDITNQALLPEPVALKPALDSEVIHSEIRGLLNRGNARTVLEKLEPMLTENGAFPKLRHDPVLHYYQALALERLEQWDEAEAAIRRTLYLDRSFLLAHYQNALLAERRGDDIGALRALDTALKLLGVGDEMAKHMQSLRAVGDLLASEMTEIVRLKRDTLTQLVATKTKQ